ncbi:MAG: hypothetical protein RR746_08990 [Lachnospiraceae bacterium]
MIDRSQIYEFAVKWIDKLSRLALLTGENPFIFEGIPKKMHIVSNNICYGPCPEPEDEVEQRLTVNTDGRVWFSAYAYGNDKPDVINRIVLDYHRLTRIKPKEVPKGATCEFVTWNYTEQLIIDRKTDTLEHIQNIGIRCKVSHKYENEDGIESLLDRFDADDLFGNIIGNPDDVVETPNETKDYTITIDYKKNPQKVITGTFDKNGLPDDFEKFADTVFDFIRFYGLGEILDPSVYSKVKRRTTDYIFCSVAFDEGHKSYYYLAEDDSIKVDDFVIVPAGKDNHETIVMVVNIEYFAEGDTPFPTDKTKHIIRKCTDEDLDER